MPVPTDVLRRAYPVHVSDTRPRCRTCGRRFTPPFPGFEYCHVDRDDD